MKKSKRNAARPPTQKIIDNVYCETMKNRAEEILQTAKNSNHLVTEIPIKSIDHEPLECKGAYHTLWGRIANELSMSEFNVRYNVDLRSLYAINRTLLPLHPRAQMWYRFKAFAFGMCFVLGLVALFAYHYFLPTLFDGPLFYPDFSSWTETHIRPLMIFISCLAGIATSLRPAYVATFISQGCKIETIKNE